ncbi:MAG: EAL domain-containing protein [Desulfuromonadales bacterium]
MLDEVRVLIVEDVPEDAELMQREVHKCLPGAAFRRVENYLDFTEGLDAFYPHLILSDYQLPHFDGVFALQLARERRPEIPFILVTGSMNEETAVECMKAGAWDYIVKERIKLLGPAVVSALEKKRLRDAHYQVAKELQKREEQYRLLIESTAAIAWEYSIAVDIWTYIAPQAEKLLGYGAGEWRNLDFWIGNLHPADRVWASQYRAECSERGESHTLEYRFRKKDGDYVWLRDVVAVEVKNGQPEILRGFMLDVTQTRQAQDLLHESEERYRSLFENNRAAMLLIDPADGAIVDANPAAVDFHGWNREEIRQKKLSDLNTLPPPHLRAAMARAQRGNSRHFQFQHRLADGTVRHVEVSFSPIAVAGRQLLFSIIHDASDRQKAERGLHLARFCIDTAAIGIYRLDEDGGVLEANAQACASLGYTEEEVLGLKIFDIDPQFTPDLWKRHRDLLPTAGFHTIETLHRRKDGTLFPVEVTVSHQIYEGRSLSFSFVRDITERKAYEKQLVHLATHDKLTGLANRSLLYDRLEQSIHYANRSHRQVAVLLIDLDRFKLVNDSLGHTAGDELLCQVARRLLDAVREADTVARLGGDEFAILLAEVAEEEHVGMVAEKIVAQVMRPFAIERQVNLTLSMGISLYPRDGDSSEMLLRNADIAMYRAKEEGNCFRFYAAGMNQRIVDTLELEADLRHAVARNELRLHFQPKIDLTSGSINGCEALLRWQHPQKGLLMPSRFIHLAEETGLILPIGEWALRAACAQIQAWAALGLPAIPVAVNLSARQFRTGNLLEAVRRIVRESGIEPRLLELELTESMIMLDPQVTAQTLLRMKELGLRLALDDFGAGYSSLNYLRRFPFDCLKIDRSFINDVATDPSAAAVATSIVAIAHSLGLHAVAEGVETQEQLDFLLRSGCETCQGYLFSKPVPAEAMADMLRADFAGFLVGQDRPGGPGA